MSLVISCLWCRQTLTELGAILLGPPAGDGRVRKDHLCLACYERVRVAARRRARDG